MGQCRLVYRLLACVCILSLASCGCSSRYYQTCDRLNHYSCTSTCVEKSDYYIVFLVTARHLDYSDAGSFLRTTAKHPADGSKNGDVGHAWVYLHGIRDGREVVIEGGHSGELGVIKARYWEGVVNSAEYGSPNPNGAYRYEANPVRYLWETLDDGFFEEGSGGHAPTCAAKISITPEQFELVASFMSPECYEYSRYSLTDQQCSSFVAAIAELVGMPLKHRIMLPLPNQLVIAGSTVRLWEDPVYSSIVFSSPDVLERSLLDKIAMGKAENVLQWYRVRYRKSFSDKLADGWDMTRRFPERLGRYLLLYTNF